MTVLYWDQDSERSWTLRAGCNDAPLATVKQAHDYWWPNILLPGDFMSRRWVLSAPLEDQKAAVLKAVSEWFDLANTDRPATDQHDDEAA